MVVQPRALGGVKLFHPPFKLRDYQAEFAARCYLNEGTILAASTGMGKTLTAIAAACMLIEDGRADVLLVGCESVKVGEWVDDLQSMTGLEVITYSGTKPQREKMRSQITPGTALVGVYETLRNDLCHKETYSKNKRSFRWAKGPLLESLTGKRIVYVADEASAKLGASRSSWMYKAHEMLTSLEVRMIAISATPVDRDPEGYFSLGRLLTDLGTVSSFYDDHVAAYDIYRKPTMFKNLYPDMCEPGKLSLKEKLDSVLLVKSKTDPDVVDSFPSVFQDHTYVRLSSEERKVYEWIIANFSDGEHEGAVYTALRQFCGHPEALRASESDLAKAILTQAEKDGIDMGKIPASKAEAFVHRVKTITAHDQVVAFTFFGQSVLPILTRMLRDEGITVSVNHGALSPSQKTAAQDEFKSGKTQVFLSSDSGSRGVNLGNAAYVEEFDVPLKSSIQVQRVNRIHRLNSVHSTVFFHAWAVRDTLEEGIISTMLTRKEYGEGLVGADAISTDELRQMLRSKR